MSLERKTSMTRSPRRTARTDAWLVISAVEVRSSVTWLMLQLWDAIS